MEGRLTEEFSCYQKDAIDKDIKLSTYVPKPLGVLDVEIKITHCGLCHTDLHLLENDWENTGSIHLKSYKIYE